MRLVFLGPILLFKKFIDNKIVLFGHGINPKRMTKLNSVKQYFVNCLIKRADFTFFYTEREYRFFRKILKRNHLKSIDNSIDVKNAKRIKNIISKHNNRHSIKENLHITQEIVLIYNARFSLKERRADLIIQYDEKTQQRTFCNHNYRYRTVQTRFF